MDELRPDEDDQTLIGTVIAGSYRITGVLGTGAMGRVYRAEDVERGTPVAIKVLHKHLVASKEAGARFRREAFVGVKLLHPSCVPVLDFGTAEDGSFYLAMELLEGESLGDLLDREGRLEWRRALRIARHVLRGLDHAHGESVVHRDIKPDNISVSRRDDDPDHARILDFGIAKLVGDAAGQAITQAGISIGTPNYLSPEQAMGGALDGRSDLYSLSIVLYEMLTGRTPFGDREPLKTLFAHASEPVPSFAEIAPGLDVPQEVEELVRGGLAKRAEDRIGSAIEYVRRIDALLGPEEPTLAATEPRPDPSPTIPARPRGRMMLALGVIAIVAGVAGVVVFTSRDRARLGSESARQATPTRPEPSPVPAAVAAAIEALEQGRTCAARRKAVQRLRALGHPSAIPHLQQARSRPRRGKNTNACLRAAAEAAIAEISRAPN